MTYSTIKVDVAEKIGTITLNRPEVRNALNRQVFTELAQAVGQLDRNDEVWSIIITGGDQVFAAGADIREMVMLSSVEVARQGRPSGPVLKLLESVRKPVIAAVAGYALGGGCELTLAADVRVAAENAIFGLPEIKLGIIPGGGGTQRLSRLIGSGRAKEMIFSGDFVDAQEALRIGLVNKVVPVDQLQNEARVLAERFIRWSPVALGMAKSAVNEGLNMTLQAGLDYEHKCFSLLFSSQDQKEGMQAFLEKRRPEFSGQ